MANDNKAASRQKFGKAHPNAIHGKSGTSEYRAYENAHCRCNNPKSNRYEMYAGRGIEFRFTSFEEFFAELGDKPTPQHSLDRIDNDGHYEPGNVRWATRHEQGRNTRCTLRVLFHGEWRPLIEIAAEKGVNRYTMRTRLFMCHWCLDCALDKRSKECTHAPYATSAVAAKALYTAAREALAKEYRGKE